MADVADLIMRASVPGGKEAEATLDSIATSADRASAAADNYGAGTQRMAKQMQAANAALKAQDVALQAHARAAGLSRHALLNLGYQVQDIGVSLASGANPFMVMAQQGSQIAQIYGGSGVGVGAALRQLLGILGKFAPMGLAIGAVAGAFALFEREVDKSTKGATTWGQTFQATINVVGKMIKDGPIGDALKWLAGFFGATFDAILDGVMWFVDKMVGHFGAAFTLIVKNWQRLPEVFGVIAQGAANITIQAVEGLINKVIEGLNYILKKVGKEAIGFVDLPEIKLANAKLAAEYKQLATTIEGNFRKSREGLFGKIVAETERLAAAQKKGAKAAKENAAAQDEVAKALEKELEALRNYSDAIDRAGIDAETLKIVEAQTMAARAMALMTKEGDALAAKFLEYAYALEQSKDQQKAWNPQIEKSITATDKFADQLETARERAERLAEAFGRVQFSLRDMLRSMTSGDIGSFILNIQDLIGGVGSLLKQGPAGIASLGAMAANAIGGKAGRAIGGGLGIAAGGLGLGAFAASGAGAAALGTLGLGAGAISGIAALAGPIGLAAGALYAAAKLFNLGGKPTNAGAGYDLRTGAISGNKRTSETEDAARSAGEAIQGIQDALKAAGIGLTDAVTGLVIGTRDQTQIYLQSGQTLRSAVGDSGAAVDTAMRALLSSATFVSEAQKALVDSALAAGKGFDAIAEILAKYEAAQGIAKSLDDEILRLTDAKAYDLKAVRDAIEEQRKAAQQLAADGYLTADQLAVITTKLATLEGLQLDEVLKRYGQAVNDATQATQASIEAATGATESARSALVEAYNREADALRETIDRFTELADSMKDFKAELTTGSLAGLNPFAQYRASAQAFTSARNALAANPGDAAAYGALQTASRQFLEASKAIAPNSAMYDRDLAAVRAATEQAETYARAQVGTAEAQLAQLTATVGQLAQLNAGVVTVAQAIANLQNALIVERQLGVTPTANDNFDVNRYLANGPDLAQNWMEGGVLRQYGSTLQEAAAVHYRLQGMPEIAAGLRKYADGGMHPGGLRLVGERGPELEVTGPARYFSAEDTQAMLGGGGDTADVVAELRQVRAEIAEVRRSSDRTALELQKMAGSGLYVRGRSPDDPVTTEAA
ncbi:phage tail length tape measure family protein [Phenylobacterium kunshanense]|uniref:Bacteriophage tail tape measure N-terminal domain-containing protein n=1 Tax=Phenylobacterium kunshanense TaxID=1445034 RepID=A0A328BS46_9CAUL|nr:phage tail length tape measure family protein [Phenylobacterium kunshanense]RAK68826.1 hypothetical protein DJ019_02085 [Phenylobacterium kunshanense]